MARREWEFFSDASGGSLRPGARNRIKDLLAFLEGKRVRVAISVVRKTRSLPQNRYYWGVIAEGAQRGMEAQWGEEVSQEDAHDLLKRECNGRDIANIKTGEISRAGQSTKFQTTLEAEEYYDRCRAFILDWFGIRVPLPNEQLAIDIEHSNELNNLPNNEAN